MTWGKLPRPGTIKRANCRKCGVNTKDICEYYMLKDEVWDGVVARWKIPTDQYGEAGMICIGCFESLLGRKLIRADFTDCPLNVAPLQSGYFQSERLRERIGATEKLSQDFFDQLVERTIAKMPSHLQEQARKSWYENFRDNDTYDDVVSP